MSEVVWMRNGDHPDDHVGEMMTDPMGGPDYQRIEGAVVRYFRNPDFPGGDTHDECGRTWHDHGWIDQGENGITVCPGNLVMDLPGGGYLVYKFTGFTDADDKGPVFDDRRVDQNTGYGPS